MNRPADFTDALRGFADDEMETARKGNPYKIPPEYFDDPHYREIWYVGLWLNVRLKRLGIPMPTIRRLCYENGKRLARGKDPWDVTLSRIAEIEEAAKIFVDTAKKTL